MNPSTAPLKSPWLLPALLLAAFGSTAPSCTPFAAWTSPADGSVVETFAFDAVLEVDLPAADTARMEVHLNGETVDAVEGPPGTFTVAIEPGPPLRDVNELVARIPLGSSDRAFLSARSEFEYRPPGKARAFRISDPADLIEGPLAHNRVGDYMLANDVARFVVQDAPRRDLHSVGQFGGNLIDAELVADPGRENFFEIQPSVNVETVIHATGVTILNDGQDGTAAIVESCGPDDLLDYINPSAQVADFGVALPTGVDDADQPVEGCTQYVLPPRRPGEAGNELELTTTLFNTGSEPVGMFVGDFLNGMGELEQLTPLEGATATAFDNGIGETLVAPRISSFSYFGFGRAQGLSYGTVGLPLSESSLSDSSFTIAGVSFILASNSILNILLNPNSPPTVSVDPGESASFSRVFVVGEGDATDAVDVQVERDGVPFGTVRGCVVVNPANPEPARGARVAAGQEANGEIVDVRSVWVTDSDGCYEGRLPAGVWGIAAAREGTPYEGGGLLPLVHLLDVQEGETLVQDFALPATGSLRVESTDPAGGALPARVTVVGFDPSPEPTILFDIAGLIQSLGGVFNDISKDPLPFGITSVEYTGADGSVELDVEPGDYRVFVSRGTEYSLYDEPVQIQAGATTSVEATLARVIDTPGFVSSDFHVHATNSPDSRINLHDRAVQFAGEGVENYIATDHDARTDPNAAIAAEGLAAWLKGTVGEEITTFDTGHYNAYPLGVDPARPTGGSVDWAGAAPPGEDFPQLGSFIRTPAEIHAEVLGQETTDGAPLNTASNLAVQINHISSHFAPLQIDTSQEPPQSFLDAEESAAVRLDPSAGNLFHPFPALELWNGSTPGAQSEFLDERIGIWMNLLNQGIPTTFIADTDTHTFLNLRTAGARTWTPAPSDDPARIDPEDVGAAVLSGRAVGGQGIYVQARLREADDPSNVADFSLGGSTTLQTAGAAGDGEVELLIDVQAPLWAEFDTIEIYANAETFPVNSVDGTPVWFDAVPTRVLAVGTDTPLPQEVVVDSDVPGASRQELSVEVPFALAEDTWFVVVVKGTEGTSPPMFPVYPSGLDLETNATLPDLLDGNLGEGGTLALGATNALWADVDGTPGFATPGVRLAP